MVQNKVSFIIPARGGSKGIPGKNIKLFCGKPLIAWQIEAALDTGLGEVFVSSDSSDILRVANEYGAIPISRPKELASDTSSSEDAILNCIERAESQEYNIADTIFFLQATSPWITSNDMLKAYIAHDTCCGSATVLTKPFHSYVHVKDKEKEEGCSCLYGPTRLMRQDMKRYMIEVGAYIMDKWDFINSKSRFCGEKNLKYYCIDRELPQEIDSPLDWKINEEYFDFWRGLSKPL